MENNNPTPHAWEAVVATATLFSTATWLVQTQHLPPYLLSLSALGALAKHRPARTMVLTLSLSLATLLLYFTEGGLVSTMLGVAVVALTVIYALLEYVMGNTARGLIASLAVPLTIANPALTAVLLTQAPSDLAVAIPTVASIITVMARSTAFAVPAAPTPAGIDLSVPTILAVAAIAASAMANNEARQVRGYAVLASMALTAPLYLTPAGALMFALAGATQYTSLTAPSSSAIVQPPVGRLITEEELRKIAEGFIDVRNYTAFAERLARQFMTAKTHGLLLHGPPGTGKSTLALYIAYVIKRRVPDAAVVKASASDLMTSLWGETMARLDALIRWAADNKAIVIIDELEQIGLARERHISDEYGEKVVSAFLSAMGDPVLAGKPWLVIATTNMSKALDPALLRPGRFMAMAVNEYDRFEVELMLEQALASAGLEIGSREFREAVSTFRTPDDVMRYVECRAVGSDHAECMERAKASIRTARMK